MIWLFLTIIFTSFLIIGFKYFQIYRLQNVPAVTFNYLTCALLAYFFVPEKSVVKSLIYTEWLPYALLLGSIFFVVFLLIGLNTQKNGVSVGAIANKLSVVIPVSIALFIYHEIITWQKIAGIVLALAAVIFASIKNEKRNNFQVYNIALPFIVFMGSGIADAFVNFIEKFFLSNTENEMFIAVVFGSAFFFGIFYSGYLFFTNKIKWSNRDVVGGILLGIPNFGSLFSLLKALQNKDFDHSTLWALLNVGVIIFSTIYALFVFKDKLSWLNILGIGLAVASIILIV